MSSPVLKPHGSSSTSLAPSGTLPIEKFLLGQVQSQRTGKALQNFVLTFDSVPRNPGNGNIRPDDGLKTD